MDLDDRGSQIAVALAATGIMLLIMVGLSGGPGAGLTPELIFAGLPLALGLAWLFPAEIAILFAAAAMFRLHEAYPFLVSYRIPLVTAMLSIVALSLRAIVTRVQLPPRWEMRLALIFALHVSVGVIFAIDRGRSSEQLFDSFSRLVAGIVFLAMLLRLPRDANKIAFLLIGSSVLVSFVAIYNYVNGIDLLGGRVTIGLQLKSLLGDPNDLCFVLMFPVAFAVGALVTKGTSPVLRIASALALPVMLAAIVFTKSRGGVLGTLALFAYFLMRNRPNKVWPLVWTGVIGAALYFGAGIGQRDYEVSAGDTLDSSSRSRLGTWGSAVRMAIDHPIFGVGMSNFPLLYWKYTDYWDGRAYTTHSVWFQVISEAGLVGGAIFVAMIWVAVRSARRSLAVLETSDAPASVRALSVSIVAAWLGLCVAGTFLSQVFSWQIFTLVTLTAVLANYVETTFKPPAAVGAPVPAGPPERGVLGERGGSAELRPRPAP